MSLFAQCSGAGAQCSGANPCLIDGSSADEMLIAPTRAKIVRRLLQGSAERERAVVIQIWESSASSV